MSTSNTFTFGSIQIDGIVKDAYERIGINASQLNNRQALTAISSLNFIFSDLINRGLNLFTVRQEMLALVPSQSAYTLPNATSDILEAFIRTSTRNLGGTPFSSNGGVAQNAFDGNSATACTQNAPNGYISYSWGAVQFAISMVGIQSNSNTLYTLTFEYSNDNVNWFTAFTPAAQTFTTGNLTWFVIPAPTLGSLFRVRETGGATLNMQELYFDTSINDTLMTKISRYEYESMPIKTQLGQPTSYWVDRQITPIINLWPTPTSSFNNMYYTRIEYIQDAGTLTNNTPLPQRFLEPATAGLAHQLSCKMRSESQIDLPYIQYLEGLYEKSLKFALEEDTERVPLRVYGDFLQGWTQQ